MEYATLAGYCREIESTDSDEAIVATLAELFTEAGEELPFVVTMVRGKIAPRWKNVEVGVSSSLTTEAILKATGVDRDALEAKWRDRGDLGAAAEWAAANNRQVTLVSETLTVRGVAETIREVATYSGTGSQDRKVETIAGLVSNADPTAARYLVRTVLGYMRIGVGDGTIRDAIAEAFLDAPGDPAPGTPTATVPAVEAVERAFQLTNDYPTVAETARENGIDGLRGLDLRLGRPVELMLAQKADGLAPGLANVARDFDTDTDPTGSDDGDDSAPEWRGQVLAEVKYDGIRVQAHVTDDEIQLFTRRLVDVTAQFPEVVSALRESVTRETAVLDGELVGYDGETGEPVAFQRFSRRVKQQEAVEQLASAIPATFHLFDCLACDGETLLDEPLRSRLDALSESFEPVEEVERAEAIEPTSVESARSLYREAVEAGHEGVMLKNLDASYQPGRRVGRMLKHKPVMEPLDLVVTRGQYSEGRRSELLGRLYLAAYDPDTDAFREVGRLSTGYTDAELERLTERLEQLVVERDGRDVRFRPETVLEVEYEEIQESPEYGSGFALRFPRFRQVRPDLAPEDADTVEHVTTLYDEQ